MMIEIIYYDENIRCYRNGVVERFWRGLYWRVVENTDSNNGYNRIKINDKNIFRHRLIAFCWKGLENIVGLRLDDDIDHINRNKLDNSVNNLRIVSNQQNSFNKNAKGYIWQENRNKWRSQIFVNKKIIHLGYFKTEADARQSYLTAKLKYHPMK